MQQVMRPLHAADTSQSRRCVRLLEATPDRPKGSNILDHLSARAKMPF